MITEAMKAKANTAFNETMVLRESTSEALDAALDAIAPELLAQGMEMAADYFEAETLPEDYPRQIAAIRASAAQTRGKG